MAERRAPSVTSRAVKPWMWMVAEASRTALIDVEVVLTVEVGMDASLEADLGGPRASASRTRSEISLSSSR